MIAQPASSRRLMFLSLALAGALVGCTSTVDGVGAPDSASVPPPSVSSTSSTSDSPTPSASATRDPAAPVACTDDPADIEKCFPTELATLERTLKSAGFRCGEDDFGDEQCTRAGTDKPTYTFRRPPDARRVFEMRYTVDVQNQQFAVVQARVLVGLPQLTRLAFSSAADTAAAAMSWFRSHRPAVTSGSGSQTRGEVNDVFTVFCHASKVGINAEGLGPRWTTTMECGISTVGA